MRVYAQEEGTCWRWLEQKAACQREHYPKEATISDLALMPMHPALHTWTRAPRSHPEADWGAGPRIRTGSPLLRTRGFWNIRKCSRDTCAMGILSWRPTASLGPSFTLSKLFSDSWSQMCPAQSKKGHVSSLHRQPSWPGSPISLSKSPIDSRASCDQSPYS